MAIVTGDRYLEKLVKFVDEQAGALIEGTKVLKLNPVGLHYVQSRLEALQELERLLAGAPVDYLRAYVSDLGDHRALEQLRRILRLLTALKVVSTLPPPARDPTPLSLLPFGRLKVLELRGCDLSTSAAKGLLELRHTLEKIICHNSTDALRHVFASRIAEIKGSPQWNRLSFVSCACNRLVLMDESLQLLPAVETLDLSRNKFAKVDNLRKCAKLKHLDLGFNQLRTISSFSEVSCHIVKLVLRNNALTTLRGVENLKSLEGLDVSYNIISNFSELELLEGLPSLQNLWLEGNPLCCARWYRAHVFSYFSHPENLKLDDKEISTREYWKRKIIVASRQKRPSSFGFYSPAKDGSEGEGGNNKKRVSVSRLVCIESEQDSTHICSDLDSVSCENEIRSREENVISEDEAEVVDLMNRVEQLKKERSVLWLREIKDWMDHPPENFADDGHHSGTMLHNWKETYKKTGKNERHLSESSRYVSDSLQASGDESSMNVLESDNSFADTSTGVHGLKHFDHIVSVGVTGGFALPGLRTVDFKQEYQKSYLHDVTSCGSVQAESSLHNSFTVQGSNRMVENVSVSQLNTINDMTESNSSSVYPGSPPHYQEDILHRRHNLVEEILQLSAESYSVASSDSDTSCSEEDHCDGGLPVLECLNSSVEGHTPIDLFQDNCYIKVDKASHGRENGICLYSCAEQIFSTSKIVNANQTLHLPNDLDMGSNDLEISSSVNQDTDCLEKRKSRRKQKRRVVSVLDENDMVGRQPVLEESNGKSILNGSDHHKNLDNSQMRKNAISTPLLNDAVRYSDPKCSSQVKNDFIEDYFNKYVADLRVDETCRLYLRCNCIVDKSVCTEREVALLLSSEEKLYVLLIGVAADGSDTILDVLGSHRVADIREVLVGLGLHVVRVYVEGIVAYLFITRSIEKSTQLLHTLKVFDSCALNNACSLRSLEQVQAELFEKQICGGSKLSIFQYSMVLFQQGGKEEESWLSRSLFVIQGHVLVCVEDIIRFSSLLNDASCPAYFSVDSCCNIKDVSEMVIEGKDSCCVTLSLESTTSKGCFSTEMKKEVATNKKEKNVGRSQMWKLKWFSEESLFQFVALMKAIHLGMTLSPLLVRCVS
ncbi:Leucine rich repeat 4 [Corchorus capsularis]|uniref:Leucine rich repeat 4 n=1 Tax=Corchorus capsularis TaxID=210143 RepID=A0A1R3JLY7_COCAP|nr:Leucine rich repeat 4 [Corchorus capsularis]